MVNNKNKNFNNNDDTEFYLCCAAHVQNAAQGSLKIKPYKGTILK